WGSRRFRDGRWRGLLNHQGVVRACWLRSAPTCWLRDSGEARIVSKPAPRGALLDRLQRGPYLHNVGSVPVVDPLLVSAVVERARGEDAPVGGVRLEQVERGVGVQLLLNGEQLGLGSVAGVLGRERGVFDHHGVVEGEHDSVGDGERFAVERAPDGVGAPRDLVRGLVTLDAAPVPSFESDAGALRRVRLHNGAEAELGVAVADLDDSTGADDVAFAHGSVSDEWGCGAGPFG